MKSIIHGMLISMAVITPAAAKSFDGPYAGITLGYNHDKFEPKRDGSSAVRDIERDSAMVGIFAGYDKTIASHFVLGGEVALNGPADNKLRSNQGGLPISVDPRLAVYVSARAGYLIDDRTMLYLRGGHASARIHTSTGQAAAIGSTLDGWHAGAGLEYAIAKHANARIEYRYTDVGGGGQSYQRQQALFGVSYRF